MTTQIHDELKILRRKQVEARTGLSRSAIYAKLKRNPVRPNEHDPTFPKPIRLGQKSVGWLASDVDTWIAACVRKSRQVGGR